MLGLGEHIRIYVVVEVSPMYDIDALHEDARTFQPSKDIDSGEEVKEPRAHATRWGYTTLDPDD